MEQVDSGNSTRSSAENNVAFADGDVLSTVLVPEHELIRCIGRGSYGEVWLARNKMGVFRAVKIVFRKSFDNRRPFERELSGIRKFEPISRSHEGFVDVLQVGIDEDQGYFYYIMELGDDQVSGQNIYPGNYAPNTLSSEISRRGLLSLEECLKLGVAVTQALAELHKHHLVHRDIKPSNIIFVAGVPKLADIGLVAGVNEARSYVGTEGFIPPEGPGTPQADIYSFGKVLYEASTGRDRRDFPEMATHWARSQEYVGLLELNEILLEACSLNPADRYASALDMQADLLVVMNGKSVKRLKALERRFRNLKRATGIVALIMIFAAAALYLMYRGWRDTTEKRGRLIAANVAYGNRALDSGDPFAALPFFAEALRLEPANLNHRLRFGSVLARCPKLTQMWFAPMQINGGQFSPDGKSVLLAEFYGKAEIHDLQTGKLCGHPVGPKYGLHSATYSPDGRYLLTASEAQTATMWDVETLSEVFSLPHPDKVYTGRFSPDGRLVVTSCKDGVARVWDARSGQLRLSLPPHADAVVCAGFSHGGQLIVTASRDGTARLWHVQVGQPAGPPLRHSRWVNDACFSPDDSQLVTAGDDHRARVWNVKTGERIQPDLRHNDAVESVEFSPDGRLILSASFDGTARLWRADNLQPIDSDPILRHGERLTRASFSPDGRLVLTTCIDGSVRIWDFAGAIVLPVSESLSLSRDGSHSLILTNSTFQVRETVEESSHTPPVNAGPLLVGAELSSDGTFVITVSRGLENLDRSNLVVRVWCANSGLPTGPSIVVPQSFSKAVLSDNAQHILVYGGTSARLYNPFDGTSLSPDLAHEAQIQSAVFSPHSDFVATVSGTNVHIWQSATGRPSYPALTHRIGVSHVEFSGDGRYLVTCCSDSRLTKCSAQVWNVKTGQRVGEALKHGDGVLSAAFSPDGRRIVTTSEDFTAKIWETVTGRQIGLPLVHAEHVNGAAFSVDGRWVATASADHTARIWDPESNNPLTPPLQHLSPLSKVTFLPDGKRLVIADHVGHTFVWRLPVDLRPAAELSELADLLSGRELLSNPSGPAYPPEHFRITWERLRTRFSHDFTTSKEEIVRWHQSQVEECESEERWSAAAFHLEYLLRFCPDDASLSNRLIGAKQHLRNEN